MMETLNEKLSLRKQQILDMKANLQEIVSEKSKIESDLASLHAQMLNLDSIFREKDEELKKVLEAKERSLGKLQQLEISIYGTKEEEPKPEKKPEVTAAYIEFYTKNVQSKPMFKKLPEFPESSEPSSPPTVNDVELDEELEDLGLSDILKKYS